jgi:hypothetical protein
MPKITSILFFILSFSVYAQTDSVSNNLNQTDGSNEMCFTYEYLNQTVEASTNTENLSFHDAIHWVGFEQSLSVEKSKGFTSRFFLKGLWTNTTFKTKQDFKLKGFRTGADFGYKFLFWNWLVLEPMLNLQYVNLRIKDKLNKSKLKNNGMLIGPEINLRTIIKKAFTVGIAVSYMWDVTKADWKESRKFNSTLSANPTNMDGIYLSIKLGLSGYGIVASSSAPPSRP